MYLRILKKDLKRKKTMNIILLMFMILASMFVSSSVNNIVTVTNGLDYYFEKANMPDYFVATMDKVGDKPISQILDEVEEIESYGVERILYMNQENFFYQGENLDSLKNTAQIFAFQDAELNYFDENNQEIQKVEPGTVWISGDCMQKNNLQIGEELEIRVNDVSVKVKIAGSFKDAPYGSELTGIIRFMIHEEDFEKFHGDKTIFEMYGGNLYYIKTNDINAVKNVLSVQGSSIILDCDMDRFKLSYSMDMLVAGILLVVSVCLILIAFVVLKFTIAFTLTEEFREIGVMKAIGLRNTSIRGLYMTKYFALALLGSSLGFFASIPFGNMLLESVSKSIVIGSDSSIAINLGCSAGVVIIILMFCFSCTSKVKKFTPVDAIHSGTTGERFGKKGILRLENVPGKPVSFLAANDVLSSPKRYGTIILIFTLCLSLVLILVNSVNTLKSGSLITSFGITESDVYYSDSAMQMRFMTQNGRQLLENELEEMENTLAEHGMPAECVNEMMFKLTLKHGENTSKVMALQGIGTTADRYEYFEGTPPQNAGEIALTPLTAEQLGVNIGDTVTISQTDGEKEYMVTAIFQSMNNQGDGVRFHETEEIDFAQTSGFFAFQIDFKDNPDDEVVEERIEKIKEIYDTDKVYNAGEYVDSMIGVADTMNEVRRLVLGVVMIIIALVTVLMERSFITKERGEIAILKAIGFRTKTIVTWHTLRFGIISVFSTLLALLLSYPLTCLTITPIFEMMGAYFGVEYRIVPLEVCVIYPLIVVGITIVSAFITSLYTRKINASEASSIE